jgi:signal transduction histidine kinase
MTATGYAFLGLTAIIATLVAVLVFAVLKFAAAARDTKRLMGDTRAESMMLTSALEEAFATLKAQERAMAARAEASERLNGQIVESLTSGLIVVDAARSVRMMNPAARRILRFDDRGVSAEDILSQVPSLNDVIVECLDGKSPVIRREITVTRVGDTMHLGVTVSPLGAGADSGGAICLFSDLTSVVALEEQLWLKDSLARLGELTAGLAHEFRNGLATIHGYGRLLKPDALPHPQREYIEGIRSETQALGEVVTNFLQFAKPDALICVPVELRMLIERAAEDVPAAHVTLSGEFGVVNGDDVLLRQAFSNLFRNSVEACNGAERHPAINVEGRVDVRSSSTILSIKDNGPGIVPAAMDKVFQPFFTTRPGGTGLGLAIVQKVIVSHNGLITAANHPEGGAAFTISFPAVTPSLTAP